METKRSGGFTLFVGSLIFLVAVTLAAIFSGLWVLTAIPVGFLFGFFMERSDLCGASSFSEVVLMRDTGKVWGLWVAIAVSMVFFAAGSSLGWIKLSPKPLLWANYVLGGIIFGVGTVLAGGCVSGCLFKAGQGNVNSMAALAAMPLGMSAVAYGPLAGFDKALHAYVIKGAGGGPVTLSSVTGAPYWLLAVIILGATAIAGILWSKRPKKAVAGVRISKDDSTLSERVLFRRWKPWQSGIAIGVLALAAYMSSAASGRNYGLGVTHGVLNVFDLVIESPVKSVYAPPKPVEDKTGPRKQTSQAPKAEVKAAAAPAAAAPTPLRKVAWWLVGVVIFIVIGSHISARMRGNFKLSPKPPDEMIIAFIGGLLVGGGAMMATACVIGHILTGVGLLSLGSVLFAIVVVLSNWATTYVYMMGGLSRS
jgi:uncharacterized membrane protein YedE/YeeE